MRLAYIADIFEQLNKLNPQMQVRTPNIMKFVDVLKAFLSKFGNWERKVNEKMWQCFGKCHPFLMLVVKTRSFHSLKKMKFCCISQHWKMNSAHIFLNLVMMSWID